MHNFIQCYSVRKHHFELRALKTIESRIHCTWYRRKLNKRSRSNDLYSPKNHCIIFDASAKKYWYLNIYLYRYECHWCIIFYILFHYVYLQISSRASNIFELRSPISSIIRASHSRICLLVSAYAGLVIIYSINRSVFMWPSP